MSWLRPLTNWLNNMNTLPDDIILDKASKGDLNALAELDAHGLIIGAKESTEDFVKRIRTLKANIAAMEESLTKSGSYEIEGVRVSSKQRIPAAVFKEAADICEKLFGFTIDWVPGFFINPSCSLLFGGCAFYFYPEFFAMFIIRESFRTKDKWLIYSRRELLSHELCHIARLGLESTAFEETFAYQTATSSFRRLLGGLFLKQTDSFLFLGSAFILLAAQILRTMLFPGIPIMPFWCLPPVTGAWLSFRYWLIRRKLAKARTNLSRVFHNNDMKVMFRCSDSEIDQWANMTTKQQAQQWIDEQSKTSPRWQVILVRYGNQR